MISILFKFSKSISSRVVSPSAEVKGMSSKYALILFVLNCDLEPKPLMVMRFVLKVPCCINTPGTLFNTGVKIIPSLRLISLKLTIEIAAAVSCTVFLIGNAVTTTSGSEIIVSFMVCDQIVDWMTNKKNREKRNSILVKDK